MEGDPRPRKRFAMKGDKICQAYCGAHLRMNVTGMVLPRKGEFYALEFSHSDTEICQIFPDHANRDILFERPPRWLINRQGQNIKTCAIPTELQRSAINGNLGSGGCFL